MRENWRVYAKFAALLLIFWLFQCAIDQYVERPPLEDRLIAAVCSGDEQELENVLRDGASPRWHNEERATALSYAAQQGQMRIALRLLDAGADVNRADNEGITPLMWAVQGEHPEMVRLLLARGANPAIRDHEGQTARQQAEMWKFEGDIVDLLREAEHAQICVNSNG
jgi:ankyrin repeat protein